MSDEFRLDSIEFGDLADNWFAHFSFGEPRRKLAAPLPPGVDIEQAIATAAESAAADLRAWAEEAEEFAATTRAGGLRQPPPAT